MRSSFKGSPLGPSAAALGTVTASPPPGRGWGPHGDLFVRLSEQPILQSGAPRVKQPPSGLEATS